MRILYSTSRFALRRQTLQEVAGLTAAWPDRRALLIVPEQTKMDMEREYLTMADQSGLMMAEILSFRRLAWRLLGEIGQEPRQSVDSVGQGMLIHRALANSKPEMHSFGHLADRPGFVRQAAAVLGDLKRYNISSSQLSTAATAAADKALRDKTGDLAVLLRSYDTALAQTGLSDAEDDLNLLGRVLRELVECRQQAGGVSWPLDRLSWLGHTSVWVSGFGETRDFTPQEDAILQALDALCSSLTLTVAADFLPFDRQAADSGADCFLPGRKSALRLLNDYPGCATQRIDDPGSGRAAEIAEDFRLGRPCRLPGQEDQEKNYLQLVRAGSLDDELAWVAGEIRRLVQLEGCRYRDITLAVCDLPGYTPRLRAVCREYGIPLFLDNDRLLSGTPLVRFVLGLIDLGLHNWPQSTIMTCLRSGLTPLEPAEIDLLENEMLARGISRPDRLFDDTRFTVQEVLASRDKAFRPFMGALNRLRENSGGSAKCRALHQFLLDYGLPERLEQRSAAMAATGETDAAVSLVQSWNELLRVLRQMSRLIGESDMPMKTFRDLLAAGLDSAGTSVIPTAIDQVTVGDLKRAMLRQTRVLMIIGASSENLPPRLAPEGLLKDQDRQVLSGLLGRQLPSSQRDQAFADAFVLYSLLTLPTGQLYMTSAADAVSPWMIWLEAGNPHAAAAIPPQPSWPDVRLNALRPALRYLLIRSGQNFSLSEPQAAGWLAVGQALRHAGMPLLAAAEWQRQAARTDAALVRVPSGFIRALYGGQPAMSVSQLERYAACPYQFLATNLLLLRERDVWAPDLAESGTLLHGIVELALRELRHDLSELDPDDITGRQGVLERWLADDDPDRRVAAWMATAAERDHLEMFFDKGIQAGTGRRVRRLAAASLHAILRQYRNDTYTPTFLEWTFGPDQKSQLILDLPDGTRVDFRGKIDRVDLRQGHDGTYFRIIDYKSGDKKVDYQALYHGLALQLPAYLEAFAGSHDDCLAEDAAYFHLTRPILSLPAGARPDDERIMATLEKNFALRGLKLTPGEISLLCRHTLRKAAELTGCLLAGDFEVAPRKLPKKDIACRYCLMQAVCGFDGNLTGCRWLTGPVCARKTEFVSLLQAESEDEGENGNAAHT